MSAEISSVSETGFVGRRPELAALRAGLHAAIGGSGRLFLVSGEPGIGKTRLAEELASVAAAEGATVCWGRCWESGGAPAYWPWIQILRAQACGTAPRDFLEQLGSGASDIWRMVPEMRAQLGTRADVDSRDPAPARARLFEALTMFLRTAAARRPLVLVLDDLHAADGDSLHLLAALAGKLGGSRLLIIGTYRRAEAQADSTVATLIAAAAAEGECMRLNGLTTAEVSAYLDTAGRGDDAALTQAVRTATGGNPFFIDAVMRELQASDALPSPPPMQLPTHVRQAVRQRLGRLSATTCQHLAVAAIIGREFSTALLAHVVGHDAAATVIAEAQAAELLKTNGDIATFVHALIAETLCDDLAASRRTQLHHTIGIAIEALAGDHIDAHVFELAHHFAAAAADQGADKAVHYGSLAAARAMASMAYDDAVFQCGRGLDALTLLDAERGIADERRRCECLLQLANAQQWAGALEDALVTCERAAAIAAALEAPELQAQAALNLTVLGRVGQQRDARVVALLEPALAALGSIDSVYRARLLAQHARALLHDPESLGQRQALADEAVGIARRLGDTDTLIHCLIARHFATGGPHNLATRSADSAEAVRLAEETGHEWEPGARIGRLCDLLEGGAVAAAWTELDHYERAARKFREPLDMWRIDAHRVLQALSIGDFPRAEQLLPVVFAEGARLQSEFAVQTGPTQFFLLRLHQGRCEQVLPALAASAGEYTAVVGHAALAWVYGEVGDQFGARRELTIIAKHRYTDIPRDSAWLTTLAFASETCAYLDDATHAETLYTLLAPFAAHNVLIGTVVACLGSAERCLGVLATTARQYETAASHFEAALCANTAMGLRPWVVRTQWQYARMLLTRGRPADSPKAAELLRAAATAAASMGMTGIEADASRHLAGQIRADRCASPDIEAQAARPQFEPDGQAWRISYKGQSVRMQDSKGLRYIQSLVAREGEHIAALALHEATPPAADTPRLTADAERARVNVTRAIVAALARLAKVHPELRQHLEDTLSTGTECVYQRRDQSHESHVSNRDTS